MNKEKIVFRFLAGACFGIGLMKALLVLLLGYSFPLTSVLFVLISFGASFVLLGYGK